MKNKLNIIGIILALGVGVFLFNAYMAKNSASNLGGSVKWNAEQIKKELINGKIDPEFQKFFDRDPERKVPDQKNIIVSPADGTVLSVDKDNSAYTITIRLSFFDVHVQRVPISGKVLSVEKLGSGFFSGKDPRYLNGVQTVTTLETIVGKVVIKQITSLFATRIVTYPKAGDKVKIGDKLGRILLGSTVIILLPDNTDITIKPGDRVYGGESVIANYK